jgi:hypothetical protein
MSMKAPTMRFSLDVPVLLKLQEKARQSNMSVTKFLQNLVNQALQATPNGGKEGNTDNEHNDEQRNR